MFRNATDEDEDYVKEYEKAAKLMKDSMFVMWSDMTTEFDSMLSFSLRINTT